jgi:hypothetical protein
MRNLTWLSILFLSVAVFGQKEKQCRDLPAREFYLNLRMEAPAEFTDFSGNKIFYNVSTGNEIVTGLSIDVDDATKFPSGFEKDFKKGLWQIVFCADTRQVLVVYRIGQQIKVKFESKKEMETRIAKYQSKL